MNLSQEVMDMIGESAKSNKNEVTIPIDIAVKIAFALGAYEQIKKIVNENKDTH